MSARRPITILLAALGGEGGTVAMEWILEAARRAGLRAQGTSIPGVAQRTGSTTYYVEIDPALDAPGQAPINFCLYPVPGGVDVLVASELLEAARLVAAGYVSGRTHLVTSGARALTTREKMQAGDGRLSEEALMSGCRRFAGTCTVFDMSAAAKSADTVVSAVMFGALAGSGRMPIDRTHCEAAINSHGRGALASLAGFSAGYEAASRSVAVPVVPTSAPELMRHARARIEKYQSETYAALFDTRVARLRSLSDRFGATTTAKAMLEEGTRFCAAWMMFDDVIRVAAEKVDPARFVRIRDELKARPDDLLAVRDYFKPRAEEVLGLLPGGLASWLEPRLQRWKKGAALRLRSDGVVGYSALKLLGSLRWLRPYGARYTLEQRRIEAWLCAIEAAPTAEVALELALCGRLVKGYGATNARAHENLERILVTLGPGHPGLAFKTNEAWAEAIAAARKAALADGEGRALDTEIARYGAIPRPVAVRPVEFRRRTVGTAAN